MHNYSFFFLLYNICVLYLGIDVFHLYIKFLFCQVQIKKNESSLENRYHFAIIMADEVLAMSNM